MGRATGILVPSRFLLTVGHFITVVMAFYAVDANVGATFAGRSSSYTSPTASEVSAAKSSLTAALSLSIICLAVCFVGLFGGFTLMFDKLNFAQCVFHFFGGVLMAWYLLDVWGYNSAWWIWGVFSLIPALMEGTVLIAHYWCNRSPSSGGGSSSSGSWRS